MPYRKDYEWVVEELDPADPEEIIDSEHCGSYAKALEIVARNAAAGAPSNVALIRHDVYVDALAGADWRNHVCTDEQGREYAYVTDGQLPEAFDDGRPIPARFRKEVRP